MLITNEVLKNLELKEGKLSEKRCQEINRMKIKNPYYPDSYFTPGEYFIAENAAWFVFSEDERIAYIEAFYPMPILRRESSEVYDDVYLLFIDDEWYEIIFDDFSATYNISDGIIYHKYTERLRENTQLDKRTDKKEVIYLLQELEMAQYRFRPREFECYALNIKYRGEEYQWRNWNEY